MRRAIIGTVLRLTIFVGALSGCALGPDFRHPDPPHADRYTSQALEVEATEPANDAAQHVVLGEQLRRDWWGLFQSDALDDVVKRALTGNRTLVAAAAAATLAQAQE